MLHYAIAYLASASVFLLVDFAWLSTASRHFYRPRLGDLLATDPNLAVAAVFYLVYVVGIVVFAVMPGYAARSLVVTMALGALLGLVAYGTYDFTNLATIRDWPLVVSLVDLAWGVFLTTLASAAGYAAVRLFAGP